MLVTRPICDRSGSFKNPYLRNSNAAGSQITDFHRDGVLGLDALSHEWSTHLMQLPLMIDSEVCLLASQRC